MARLHFLHSFVHALPYIGIQVRWGQQKSEMVEGPSLLHFRSLEDVCLGMQGQEVLMLLLGVVFA